jgi:S-adenosylmethionine hydrolase
MATANSVITLTTDFGIHDGFPASMHGVILSINPNARLVDLCHGVSPGDIAHGAYILTSVARYFPPGTVHIGVVDPGVGTMRRILAIRTIQHVYIAPDNGLLGYVLQSQSDMEVRYLDNPDLWLENPSATFHGRDIMAPTAAHLTKGVPFLEVGPVADTWQPAPFPPPTTGEGTIQGHVIHIDHFGNLITNLPGDRRGIISIGNLRLEARARTFAEGRPGAPIVLVGSSGWLEIAVKDDSAARILNARVGDRVEILPSKTP